jgi:hypothetical protein
VGMSDGRNILAANLAPQIRLLFLVRHHRSAGSNQASESGIPTTIFLVLLPLGIGVGVGVGVSLQLKRLKTALYGCGHTVVRDVVRQASFPSDSSPKSDPYQYILGDRRL